MAVFFLIGAAMIGSIDMKVAREQALTTAHLNTKEGSDVMMTDIKDSYKNEEEPPPTVLVKREIWES